MQRFAALFAVVVISALGARPQSCPNPGDIHRLPPSPMCSNVNPMGWQSGALVTVYISDVLPLGLQTAIEQAYTNWNGREGSGLTLTFEPFNVVIQSPTEPYSEWQVYDDQSEGCMDFMACTYDDWCPNGYTLATKTNVKPGYTGTGDQLFAHEVGHTYGFDECTAQDCYPGVTIMEQDEADERSKARTQPHGNAAPRSDCIS
jgi:hypothetical protein